MNVWLGLFSSLVVTVGGGAALGGALGLTGLLILQFYGSGGTELAVLAVYNLFSNFTLSALAMFILLGELLLQSGLSKRTYEALSPAFRSIPGGLLHTNVVVCTIFGAVSGSSTAGAAAVGSAAYPELVRRGYRRDTVLGSLAGAGTLGILIPPSLTLLLYGAWQEVSIGRLFLAGILPGLMMAGLFMIFIFLQSLRDSTVVPEGEARETLPFFEILRHAFDIWPLVVLIAIVLGTIYLGIATPTESAALGVLAATVLGFWVSDLTLRKFFLALWNSVINFGALKLVFIGAIILNQAVSQLGLPRDLIQYALSFELSKYQILLFVVVMYIALGCLFDGLSLMLLTLPFVFPVLIGFGFDPIWLGVFMTMMIEIGAITPPVGVNLYVLSAVTRQEVPLASIARATIPYWLLLLLGVALITTFPGIALVIPNSVY